MRIVAGEFGGRPLKSLDSNNTRPTTDKVKESIFSALGGMLEEGNVLDLYAGSGGLGIEAVSRGATTGYLIDNHQGAINVIKENVAVTKAPEKFKVIKSDANAALKTFATQGLKFDYVFLDPPYALQKIEEQLTFLSDNEMFENWTEIVVETAKEVDLPEVIGAFSRYKEKKYGITKISFYEVTQND
ncbi:MAG: 16S rRNA (guanine(966)-N(2))-methyltransferase RsmD [Lactobacillales bacterium]|jgi:16S rRNA (guanine966-N2)-methyltransferase|nr:16S rRNA (guanine(966)-N(2))-methyltransferase RsmD [Lactobacillales bacterium]